MVYSEKENYYKSSLISTVKSLPYSPGIYRFYDNRGVIIYVGKAINLHNRVTQYFQKNTLLNPKTSLLVSQIYSVDVIPTISEFDALLLEAKLIYDYQPKYNIIAKDNKSSLYIKISFSDILPKISYIRKTELQKEIYHKEDAVFGPFQSARIAKDIMRTIRHIIPYCMQRRQDGKPCFYTHIGLCSPCPSVITRMKNIKDKDTLIKIYRSHMYRICDILAGKSLYVQRMLEREMKEASHSLNFEQATSIRNNITALINLQKVHYDPMVYLESDMNIEQLVEKEEEDLLHMVSFVYPHLTQINRLECIDVSNIGGTYATGSLVVFTDGISDKKWYRKFKIKRTHNLNDYAMVSEVVKRRFLHTEWPLPDLLVIDGGSGHVSIVLHTLNDMHVKIPVIGLAKRYDDIILPFMGKYKKVRLPLQSPALQIIQRVRDEAHRFAITYHKFLRSHEMQSLYNKVP